MGWLNKLFPQTDWAQLFNERKALLVDVRSPQEFKGGHAPGAVNIPLQMLDSQWKKLQGKEPVVLCCASGARSGMAKRMLQGKGMKEVYNIGPWHKANRYLR